MLGRVGVGDPTVVEDHTECKDGHKVEIGDMLKDICDGHLNLPLAASADAILIVVAGGPVD